MVPALAMRCIVIGSCVGLHDNSSASRPTRPMTKSASDTKENNGRAGSLESDDPPMQQLGNGRMGRQNTFVELAYRYFGSQAGTPGLYSATL